jgi:ferritin
MVTSQTSIAGSDPRLERRFSVAATTPERSDRQMRETVQAALNDQIKHELASAYFYLAAASYFETRNLTGCAHWMRVQSREEIGHALKFLTFMHDRGGRVQLQALDPPPSDFASPLDAFSQALQKEEQVTAHIHRLYALAVDEQDYPAQVLLQWFITEQVEEEKSATTIVEELKMAGDSASALLLLNRELGTRRAE